MPIKRPFAAVPIQLGARYRAKARREKRKRFVVAALVLTVAAIVCGLVGVLPSSMLCSLQPAYDQTVAAVRSPTATPSPAMASVSGFWGSIPRSYRATVDKDGIAYPPILTPLPCRSKPRW